MKWSEETWESTAVCGVHFFFFLIKCFDFFQVTTINYVVEIPEYEVGNPLLYGRWKTLTARSRRITDQDFSQTAIICLHRQGGKLWERWDNVHVCSMERWRGEQVYFFPQHYITFCFALMQSSLESANGNGKKRETLWFVPAAIVDRASIRNGVLIFCVKASSFV